MNCNQYKIIALDIHNAIIDNLESWFVETDLINCSVTKNQIRKLVNEEKITEDSIHCVFLINDIIIGTSNNSYFEIKYSNFLIDDLMLLKPISLSQLELYRSVIIDWIFNQHNQNEFAFQAIQSLQVTETEKYQFPNFTNFACAIDVIDLGFKLNDFFIPLNQKFKSIHQFFSKHYQTNKILKNVNLTRVFLVDKLILGYSFQMEGSFEEHFFWSIFLEEHLFFMDKFTFTNPLDLTVDGLLDKINLKGIESLTEAEVKFLSKK